MYTKEQEEVALGENGLGSGYAAIRRLGCPSESTRYRWYEHRKAGLENRHGHVTKFLQKRIIGNMLDYQRYPSAEFKYEVLRRYFELGGRLECVSKEIGYICLISSSEWPVIRASSQILASARIVCITNSILPFILGIVRTLSTAPICPQVSDLR